MKLKSNGYWTKERCLEEAKKYRTKTEWVKNSGGSYKAAIKNNWFDECVSHMIHGKIKWTKDGCLEEAKKYRTKKEWRENSTGSYQKARKMGWMDNCSNHMEPIGNRNKRMVYAYIFPDRFVYVGLTCDEVGRKNDHLIIEKKRYKNKKLTPVTKHMIKTGLKPKYKKICSYIDALEAIKIEDVTIKNYKKSNYKLLNTAKAGSLGGIFRIWTKELCLKEAKKYDCKKEWQKNSGGSYGAAKFNGWINECSKHMHKRFIWTQELCIKEAKKYKTVSEWQKNSGGSYGAARFNGWINECSKHMSYGKKQNGHWQLKENCLTEAKKYKTITEWKNKSGSSLNAAKENEWLEECTQHMIHIKKPNGYWTKERCLEEAKKYSTVSEWQSNSGGSFSSARKNKWYDECCKHMKTNKSLTHKCTI